MTTKAFAFLVLLLVFAAVVDQIYAARVKRIINGYKVEKDEIPYQAFLTYIGHVYISCGGAIISDRHILTAAHCVNMVRSLDHFTVKTGSINESSSNSYSVKKIKYHENYVGVEPKIFINDIAVITLNEAIKITASQKPISLPTKETPANVTGLVSGFGITARNLSESEFIKNYVFGFKNLNAAQVKIISNDECDRMYRSIPKNVGYISSTNICSFTEQGIGSCKTDSGGPLVYNNELVGIVSCSEDCGDKYPNVYTRVYKYLDWIKEAMK